MPIDWMLAVLRDPEAEQSRRDQMAIQAAPYLHPRLAATAIGVTSTNGGGCGSGGGDTNIVQIISIPRGALFDAKTGMITMLDGSPVTELPTVTPYECTPALSDQTEQLAPVAEPLPVIELDPANVTRLDQYKAKRDDDDEPSSAA
jgi:hypothetical protein